VEDHQNSLSIVLPVYNEERNIRETVENALQDLNRHHIFHDYEIILVNDGSTDGTAELLNEIAKNHKRTSIISHTQNLGYGRAMASGIGKARFPYILLMDADGQFKINSIKEMIHYFPEYDIVTGVRLNRADAFYRVFLGAIYTTIACTLFHLKLRDLNCGFKMFKKEALTLNGVNSHSGVFYTELYLRALSRGCKIKEIPVDHYPRKEGRQTGASLKVMVTAVSDLIKLRFREI